MRGGGRVGGLLFNPPLSLSLPPRRLVRTEPAFAISLKDSFFPRKGNLEFLTWLQQKSGQEISSVLSIGTSTYGRSLFATRFIQAGECILKIPYTVHITKDEIPSVVKPLIGTSLSNIAWLALVVLAERRRGQDSVWAPYISSLPCVHDMNCSIFWSNDELEMIRPSPIYEEALLQRIQIENDFHAIKEALGYFSQIFGDISYEDFIHAYSLVLIELRHLGDKLLVKLSSGVISCHGICSLVDHVLCSNLEMPCQSNCQSWISCMGNFKGLIFDFLNHNGNSEAVLVNDEENEISEVIADKDYAEGEQVLIRYGKFPNATLLLDFGFTVPNNMHEQVQISIDVPLNDPLHSTKMELLQRYCMPTVENISTLTSLRGSFTIKEVRSLHGKGKGIPLSLRAFVRVLSAKSCEELKEMCQEATENDGRLGRRPLRNRSREIEAHCILISHIKSTMQEYNASIELLESRDALSNAALRPCRRRMARDLLAGELRVLKSVCAWLTNYCSH